MGFNDGDFVLIEYSIRVKETGNLIDTTNEEVARKEGIYETGRVYGPTLIIIGKKWVNEVVENEIRNMDVGEEKIVEVPPEKAFGHRDPGKVKVFSLREFQRRGIDVRVGEVLDFGGVKGTVKSISGGRVVVDFNHPLAGKTLIYQVKVVAKLEDSVEKLKALSTRHLQIPSEEISVEYDSGSKTVTVTIPSKHMTKTGIQYGKLSLATDILELFKDQVDTIVFREVISRKKEAGGKERAGEESGGEATGESGEQGGA